MKLITYAFTLPEFWWYLGLTTAYTAVVVALPVSIARRKS